MTDRQRKEQHELWDAMRAITPSPATKTRVLQAIEHSPTNRLRWAAYAVPALAACMLAFWVQKPADTKLQYQVSSANGVQQDGQALANGDWANDSLIEVSAAGHFQATLQGTSLYFQGPASLQLSPDKLTIKQGTVEVQGTTKVVGPQCSATIEGKSRVTVVDMRLQVTVFAGTASITQPVEECLVLYSEDTTIAPRTTAPKSIKEKSTKEESTKEEPTKEEPTKEEPHSENPLAVPRQVPAQVHSLQAKAQKRKPKYRSTDANLTKQTQQYWQAQSLRKEDPSAALQQLRAFKKKWPDSPLRQEIDLAHLDTLIQLGRAVEVRNAAKKFLRRYPRSSRSEELTMLIQTGTGN